MSGAMVGIVVACLAMLFLLLVALIIFLVCRRRLLAAKPPQSRRATADVRAMQESGCGLPVDIPVEALTREPPPRYASVVDLSTSDHDVSISALPPPPPYSLQVFLPLYRKSGLCMCSNRQSGSCCCAVQKALFLPDLNAP